MLFTGDTEFAVVKAFDGEMGFLYNHAPLISELGIGEVTLRDKQSKHQFFIEGGLVEIHDNVMIILAESTVKKDELNSQELEEKLKALHQDPPHKYSKEWMTIQIEEQTIKAKLKVISR